jgi:hypothetical protein
MTTPRRAFTALLLAGLVLAPAGAASAQTVLHHDAQGDVRQFTDSSSSTSVPAPTIRNGDVKGVRFTHGSTRVSVRIVFVDLQRAGAFRGDFVRIVTNEGLRRELDLYAAPGAWAGKAELDRPDGNRVRCSISRSIDYTANTVSLSFPRSCISKPRWVRLGIGSFWATSDSTGTTYADDVLMDNAINANTVRLSGRLYRG